jgi:hypothetical protein
MATGYTAVLVSRRAGEIAAIDCALTLYLLVF